MKSRLPILLLFISTFVIAVLYAIALARPLTNEQLLFLALALALALTSMMAIGMRRTSALMRVALLLTFLCIASGFAIAILSGAPRPGDKLYFGLPPGAAAVVFIAGLIPLIVLPFVYAFTFDDRKRK